MDERKLKGLLGLSLRAGQAVFGEENCRKAVSQGTCEVLLLDESASNNTRKRYEAFCEQNDIRLAMLPEGLIEAATGKPGVAMAIRKGSLAEQVTGCL